MTTALKFGDLAAALFQFLGGAALVYLACTLPAEPVPVRVTLGLFFVGGLVNVFVGTRKLCDALCGEEGLVCALFPVRGEEE